MRYILAILLTVMPALGQSTSVTATITDTDGQTWNNGTVTATFIPGNPQNYKWPGGIIPNSVPGTMNGAGTFTISLPDNTTITPLGSAWRISICPNASAPCVSKQFTVSGASMNLSAQLSAIAIGPRFPANAQAYGYLDIEIAPAPLPGSFYWNVTTLIHRQWTGTVWQDWSGGGGGGGIGSIVWSLPSFMTATPSTISASGTQAFSFNSQAQSLFFSSPSGSSGAPGFRSIVASDIPTLNQSTTGNAATATSLSTPGTSTTVLHGNASGAPSYGSVSLANDTAGVLPVSKGGSGVGTVTGPLKGNGTSAFSAAGFADIIALWTGTCSATTYLRGDGSCQTPAGGGSIGGSGTTGFVPLYSPNGTTLGNSHIDEVSNAGYDTFSQGILINDGTGVSQIDWSEGTAPAGIGGHSILWSDSSTHRAMQNPNNIGGLMIPGVSAAGTAGHNVVFAANGIDLADGGGSSTPTFVPDAGAGTSPAISITAGSTDFHGWVNLTTGTAPVASSGVITITYGGTYSVVPKCSVSPANTAAAALSGTQQVWVQQADATVAHFVIRGGSTVLSGTYQWEWECGYK